MTQESIHSFAQQGNFQGIKNIVSSQPSSVNSKDEDERIALHWSSSGGFVEITEFLLASGSEVNSQDEENWTPLICAVGKLPGFTSSCRKNRNSVSSIGR